MRGGSQHGARKWQHRAMDQMCCWTHQCSQAHRASPAAALVRFSQPAPPRHQIGWCLTLTRRCMLRPSGVSDGMLLSLTKDGNTSAPAVSMEIAQAMPSSATVDVAWRLPLLFQAALLPLPGAGTLLDGGFTYAQLSGGAYTFALDDEISGTGGGPAFVARERLQMQSVVETYLVLVGSASVRAPVLRVRGIVVCVTLARCVETQLDRERPELHIHIVRRMSFPTQSFL